MNDNLWILPHKGSLLLYTVDKTSFLCVCIFIVIIIILLVDVVVVVVDITIIIILITLHEKCVVFIGN